MNTVLIVDDYHVNQRLYTQILKKGGFASHHASNGMEALDVMESEQIDLLISDLEMPEMDGLELASAVRSHPVYSDLPIIMVTGSGVYDDESRAEAVGIEHFLRKPVSSRELLDAVKHYFSA